MNKRLPDVLFLSSSWPHGDAFGGQLRALHTGRALKHVGKVTLTVVSSDPGYEEAMQKAAEEFEVRPPILATLKRNRGIIEKMRWALDPYYLNVHGLSGFTGGPRPNCLGFDAV